MNIYWQRKGRDTTVDPYYIPEIESASTANIEALTSIVNSIQQILNGSDSTKGLIEQVTDLNGAIEDIQQVGLVNMIYKTTVEWNNDNNISQKGTLYVYTDAAQIDGQDIPRIKIGNGINKVKDIYFVDQDVVNALNNIVSVTEEEKESWNNKVSCSIDPQEENLIFSK